MPEEATPQEEVKKEEVKETSTSEKVENSEETQSQETKPEAKEVPQKEVPQEEKEEKKETPKEEVSEAESKSVLDELLAGAQEKAQKSKPVEETPVEETKSVADKTEAVADKTGTGDFEKEIARTAFPKMDPNSPEWDSKFEEKVVKEYLYRWALTGGGTGPTLRSIATQISKEEADATPKPVDQKKADATAQPSTVTGTEAEKTITADEEKTLLEGAKSGNQEAIVKLLRTRREKSE